MNQLEWHGEKEFTVNGVKFLCALNDESLKTNDERFVLLKDRGSLESYAEVFSNTQPRTVLEFGIFQGGSPTLFSLWWDLEKFVGVDLCPPVVAFDEFCRGHPAGQRIRAHYGVSQTDKARIDRIILDEFGDSPLDVVIDDASHLYGNTRRTFEIAFPHLRPGGTYVIEDWGWAHWPGRQYFAGEAPMSALIMELIMSCASRSDAIGEVRVFGAFVFIRKGTRMPALTNMSLDSLYSKRDIEIVTSESGDFLSVARLFARKVAARARTRARQWLKR